MKKNSFSVSRQYGSDYIVIDKGIIEDIVSDIDFKPKEFNKSSITKIIDLKEIPKDEVITVNCKVTAITGKKKRLRMYHSGYIKQYPGCLVGRTFWHRHFNKYNVPVLKFPL